MSAPGLLAAVDLRAILPELTLAFGGVALVLLEAFLPRLRALLTPLALAALLAAAWLTALVPAGPSYGGLLIASPVTTFIGLVVLLAAVLSLLSTEGYLRREGILAGEYHALFLWCVTGVLLLARATELVTIFLALELLSICLYSLAAFHRRLAVATEAALKYFLMGAFVSAFVLYGIALVWGETASTRLAEIGATLQAGQGSPLLLTLGFLLLISGFGFKMSLVPFHAWAPDAYQGSPSPFVAFLSVAPKAASAIVIWRLLELVAPDRLGVDWPQLMAVLAVASILVGNLLALVQRDIKRMLAYSGIAHMGYLLIPFASPEPGSLTPVLVYLLAYALMNAGAFGLVAMLYARPGEQHLISELSGWGNRYPLLGACLAVCMLSLGGIPPTAGFLGKYLVFLHAIRHGQLWLAVIGIAGSLIGVFYYLRVVYTLYMKDELAAPEGLRIDLWGRTAALVAAGGTLFLGLWPQRLLAWLATALR